RAAAPPSRPAGREVGGSSPPLERVNIIRVIVRPKLTKPQPRIRIETVRPQVDCGRHPTKNTVGEDVEVSAKVFRDGHDVLGANVLYRGPRKRRWSSAPLELVNNDLFTGTFEVTECGPWEFAIEAWTDRFATFRDELERKVEAGQEDLSGELAEGSVLLGIPDLDLETALATTVTEKHGAT